MAGILSARRSGWDRDNSETDSLRKLTAGAVVILLLGIVLGVGGSALFSDGPARSADRSVISPDIEAMKIAPKTEDGAVQAVTSYITGFPSVALQSTDQQRKVLQDIVDPTAAQSLRSDLARGLINARDQIAGSSNAAGAPSARLVVSPASYKVDLLGPERARVQVWFQTVLVDGSQQRSTSLWTTNDIQVQWSDHWRLLSLVTTGGPTPNLLANGGAVSTYSDVLGVVNGFKAYRPATAETKP